jgi:hypothetical protein
MITASPRYKKSEHVKTYYQVNHLSEGNLW